MSLKSFDKFCEKMINNEPIDNKDIFDERQSVMRMQITLRAFQLFTAAACLNILIMECGGQWCESYVCSTALCLGAAYIFWLVKNARKGSLFGIKGTKPMQYQASVILAEGVIFPLYMISEREDFFECFFIRNGKVSEHLMLTVFFLMCVFVGAAIFILAHRYNRRRKFSSESEE